MHSLKTVLPALFLSSAIFAQDTTGTQSPTVDAPTTPHMNTMFTISAVAGAGQGFEISHSGNYAETDPFFGALLGVSFNRFVDSTKYQAKVDSINYSSMSSSIKKRELDKAKGLLEEINDHIFYGGFSFAYNRSLQGSVGVAGGVRGIGPFAGVTASPARRFVSPAVSLRLCRLYKEGAAINESLVGFGLLIGGTPRK